MRKRAILLLLICILLADTSYARKRKKNRDGYPYDRSTSGCVKGDCVNGAGVYVFPDDDIFDGYWRNGKRHGKGVYYFVDNKKWPQARRRIGRWIDGEKHGKFTYVNASGGGRYEYWYLNENVGDRVHSCRDAKTLTDAYKGFVAILNGAVAASRGDDILESAAEGYYAADRQLVPLAVDLSCSQLLKTFE